MTFYTKGFNNIQINVIIHVYIESAKHTTLSQSIMKIFVLIGCDVQHGYKIYYCVACRLQTYFLCIDYQNLTMVNL